MICVFLASKATNSCRCRSSVAREPSACWPRRIESARASKAGMPMLAGPGPRVECQWPNTAVARATSNTPPMLWNFEPTPLARLTAVTES